MRPESILTTAEASRPTPFPPHSVAFVLAGYLTSETVHGHFPGGQALPLVDQREVEIRFGAAARRPVRSEVPVPQFFRVDDREVLDFVHPVALLSQPNLSSLSGWEWVDVGSLLAGRLATGSLSDVARRLPTSPTDLELAKYSLLSFGYASPNFQLDSSGTLVCDAHLSLAQPQFQMERSGFITARYGIQPIFNPIRVVVLHNRAIAVQGLERLALLARRGIRRTLALVHYGYGLEMLPFLSFLSNDVLFGPAPPLVSEFADPNLAVEVPAPNVLSVTRFSAETLYLGG